LSPTEKETIARKWCSEENSIELISDNVMLQSDDGQYFNSFQFDIASRRHRHEYEEFLSKQKELKSVSSEIDKLEQQRSIIELSKYMGFDPAVPDKREILGMVKSGKHHISGTNYHAILGDCYLLSKAEADKKYMILTDKEMYEYFFRRCYGILDGIILKYLDVEKYKELLS